MDPSVRKQLISIGGGTVVLFGPQGLHDIRCYYESMEGYLSSSSKERHKQIQKRISDLDTDVAKTLLNKENDLLWEDYFPSELRASTLVTITSYFERYLDGVCSETSLLLRAPVSHKFLRGSCIDRAEIFLVELCKLSGPEKKLWDEMKRIQKIRNRVVHNGGLLDTPHELANVQRLIEGIDGVSCCELGIEFSPEFIRYALNVTSKFFDEMILAIKEVCERVKMFEQ